MNPGILLVLTTFPDPLTANAAARELVDARLAACCHLLPSGMSIFRWKGAIDEVQEILALFKTTEAAWPAFQERLKSLHPYEVPEMLALRPEDGWPPYLAWVRESTQD